MQHHEMIIQKMKNAPKIRDDDNKEYRASSTKKVEDEAGDLQSQVDALEAALEEHRTDSPVDHPEKSVTEVKLADNAASDRVIGQRTVDQTAVPSGNAGALTNLLSWIVNRIKAITGNVNWTTDPVVNLVTTKAHIDDKDNPHETTAIQVPYDNTTSLLTAENVQAAVDEIVVNYPKDVRFRKNGSNLEASLDGGTTWKVVTLT
jgi:hypothetical protein